MHRKGYAYEARFIQTICDWRRACDNRGLTELQRCRFNYQLLNLVLDELMPWHTERYDLSCLEVNRYFVQSCSCTVRLLFHVWYITLHIHFTCTPRPINNILGFTRESLVPVITNIEGREWYRRNILDQLNIHGPVHQTM